MNTELLLALFQIGQKTFEAIEKIKAEDPAAYEAVAKHHAESLAAAQKAAGA